MTSNRGHPAVKPPRCRRSPVHDFANTVACVAYEKAVGDAPQCPRFSPALRSRPPFHSEPRLKGAVVAHPPSIDPPKRKKRVASGTDNLATPVDESPRPKKTIPLKTQHITRKCRGNTIRRRYNGGVHRSSKIEISIESRGHAVLAIPSEARALPGSPRKVKFPNELNPRGSSCG